MNKILKPLFATLLLAGSTSAFAASSVDLSVVGLITPSACVPTLSNGGKVDYGKISVNQLNPTQSTFLPTQTLVLTVTCDAATLIALEPKDNRDGSATSLDGMEFGLGFINVTEKLGSVMLRMESSPVADGRPVRNISSYDGGSTWRTERYLLSDAIHSVADTTTVAPIPVQLLTSVLSILPSIAPTNGLTLNNEVAIDGSVTLTVRYL